MMEAAIELKTVSKSYKQRPAVQNLSFEVGAGEMFGFLGPNGAGKTTTIRLMLGLLRPDAGQVRLLGQEMSSSESQTALAKLGFLPDVARIDGGFSGGEWLDYLAALQNAAPNPERRNYLCQRLELAQSDLKRKIRAYSRGMRQKLAIIQTLQHQPALLIMDEPTEGLDPLAKRALFELLAESRRENGTTVFFSSHILSEVEKLCDRVALIRVGQLAAIDTIVALRQKMTRRVSISLKEEKLEFEAALQSLEGVEQLKREAESWRMGWRGDLNPLLKLLADWPVRDLTIEPADLEDVFLSYYRV